MTYTKPWHSPKCQHSGAKPEGLLVWGQFMLHSKTLSPLTLSPKKRKKRKEGRAATDDINWRRTFKIIVLTERILCFALGQPRKTELCFRSQKWNMTVLSVYNPSQDIILLKTSPNWKSPRMPLVEQRGKKNIVPVQIYSRWKKVVPWAREPPEIWEISC